MEKNEIKNLISDIKENDLDKTATFTDLVSKRQYKKIKEQDKLDKTIKLDKISEEDLKNQITPIIDNKNKLDEISNLYDDEFVDNNKTSEAVIILAILLLISSILFIIYNILFKSLLNQPLEVIIKYLFVPLTGLFSSIIFLTKNKVKDFISGIFILIIISYMIYFIL